MNFPMFLKVKVLYFFVFLYVGISRKHYSHFLACFERKLKKSNAPWKVSHIHSVMSLHIEIFH